MYTPLEKKEIEYLYARHNKKWKNFELDVKESNIVFPKTVSKIVNKEKPLTDREKDIRKKFRDKVLRDLGIQSASKQRLYWEEKNEKNKKIAEKRKATLEIKNAEDENMIKHFGVWRDKRKNLKIGRDTYAIIDNMFREEKSKIAYYQKKYAENPDAYKDVFTDSTCTYLTDEWCTNHREKCLLNYDLNMGFMSKLSKDDFEKEIEKLKKQSKTIKEIYDLKDVDGKSGIYILVLDEYKQMYIGQSGDMKKRIMDHWSKTKEFHKLIFGQIETSGLSIDSFGALDTTRIFVYPTLSTQRIEEELVDCVDNKYLLNRTKGGILVESELEKLEIVANMNSKDLKQG